MHIICLQNNSVQTKNRHILEKLMFSVLKGLIIIQVKQNAPKKLHSLSYFELTSWFLQYLIIIRHKMIIGLFIRIKMVAFDKSDHKIIKGF